MSFGLQLSGCDAFKTLPRKVMVVRYFAETKGVVGCQYGCRLAFKMRDLMWFLN
jgi:hypothetical protein